MAEAMIATQRERRSFLSLEDHYPMWLAEISNRMGGGQ